MLRYARFIQRSRSFSAKSLAFWSLIARKKLQTAFEVGKLKSSSYHSISIKVKANDKIFYCVEFRGLAAEGFTVAEAAVCWWERKKREQRK